MMYFSCELIGLVIIVATSHTWTYNFIYVVLLDKDVSCGSNYYMVRVFLK
jgi:hypothetical protein